MVEDIFKYGGYLLGFLGTGKTGRTGSYLTKIGTGKNRTGSGTVDAGETAPAEPDGARIQTTARRHQEVAGELKLQLGLGTWHRLGLGLQLGAQGMIKSLWSLQ